MEELTRMGLALVILGLALALSAPHLPRNPVFGLRVGYSYASPRVWRRVNREAGILLAVVGLATILAERLAGPRVGEGLLAVGLLGVTLGMVLRARRLAEWESLREPDSHEVRAAPRPLGPIRVGGARLVVMVLASLVALAGGNGGLEFRVGVLSVLGVFLAFALLARRAPMFFYNPWIPVGELAVIMLEGFLIVQLSLAWASWDSERAELAIALGGVASTLYVAGRFLASWAGRARREFGEESRG